jgi:tetratricopeptide (TPR) repeat protein
MKKRYLRMFLILSLIIWGLLSVFSFSFATGQGGTAWETLSQEAFDYLEMAINKMEEAVKTYQGVNYPNKELWAEAIDYGEKAVEADPNFIEAHYRLAQIYQYTNWYYREAREWGRYIELIQKKEIISPEAEQKLVEVDLEMIEAHYWLARVFYEEGRLNDSLSSWKKVLEVDPYYPRAQYFYTKVENSIKYGKEAYSHYEAGYNLYEQRLFEEALYEYRQAVRSNSNFSAAYYWLGRIYYERGNYQEAASNWKEVLRLEPENTKAEYWLRQAEKQGE